MTIPGLCAICRRWTRARVCGLCIGRFAPACHRCFQCALRVPDGMLRCGACLRRPPPFDHAVAAVDYRYPWAGLIASFKFNEALDLSGAFARLLLAAQQRSMQPLPDLLLPVPLSTERLRSRGFNQAWELTRRLGRHLRCAADPRLLLRIRDTRHQLDVARGHRHLNVRDAFAVEPLRASEIEGRRVALIDDVMTTGATVAELSRVARQAGASSVRVWVLARTPLASERTSDAGWPE